MLRRYLIIRHGSGGKTRTESHLHNGNKHLIEKVEGIKSKLPKKGIPYEIFANELMEYEPFIKYLQEHGSHFTKELADHAIRVPKQGSFMDTDQVEDALIRSSLKLPKDITLGDFTYLVNSEYHAHSDAIAKAMEKVKRQPYPGFIFNRWLADHIGMGQSIPWEEFI